MMSKTFLRRGVLLWLASAVLLGGLLLGCQEDRYELFRHFVYEYEVEDYEIELTDLSASNPKHAGWLEIHPLDRYESHRRRSRTISAGSRDAGDQARFLKLSERNGDLSYNVRYSTKLSFPREMALNVFYEQAVLGMRITSNVAWGEGYPAGSDLGELFGYVSVSADKFIRQGYKLDRGEVQADLEAVDPSIRSWIEEHTTRNGGYSVLNAPLSEVRFAEHRLLGSALSLGYLRPLVTPPAGAQIKLHVTFEGVGTKTAEYVYP